MSLEVAADGSFTVTAGSIRLADCFPGIDGASIRPVRVMHTQSGQKHRIDYQTLGGAIRLDLSLEGECIAIESSVKMIGMRVLRFYPIYRATLQGVRGLYRQGLGICGPSGYLSLAAFRKNDNILQMFRSHGIAALVSDLGCVTALSDSHRRFAAQFEVNKLEGEDYRELWSSSFAVEGVDAADLALPTMHLAATATLDDGLATAAMMISRNAGVTLKHEPPVVWCSWYYLYHTLSRQILSDYLRALDMVKPKLPFSCIQIDAGYFPSAGDWLDSNSLWPGGIRGGFDEIRARGYTAGVWIGPYMVGNQSALFREHPDWMLRRNDGGLVVQMQCYNEPRMWGYRDQEYYVLDTSHPAAMEYLRRVFRTLRQWGATYFKTDFMLWGLHDSATVRRYTPGKTSVEYLVDLLRVIREEIGPESYWLGCIAPFGPMIGFVDAMRIAGDVGAKWGGELGAMNLIRESVGSSYFNHVYWHNDPDAMMLRDFHIQLSAREIESLCLLQAVSGGLVATSEPMHEIADERRALFRFVLPHGRRKPRIPYLDQTRDDVVMSHNLGGGRHLVFVLNPTDRELVRTYSLAEVAGVDAAHVRRWKDNCPSEMKQDSVKVELPARECALYFVSESKPIAGTITNIWEWN